MNANISPLGEVLTDEIWNKEINNFLPSNDDNVFIVSLMQPVFRTWKICWLDISS